ncbi:MAG: hypothetical protein WC471_04000 [Candidatus Woesearchaeota archaeon]|jgi:hypothetical protein
MTILFDQDNLPEDVLEVIFATDQQVIVSKELIKWIKEKGGEVNKTEMSLLANALHDGTYECEIDKPEYRGKKVKLSYNKRQFYDRILTPMRSMGLIDYDLYRKVYKLSDKFGKNMERIRLLWVRYLNK